MKKYLAIILIIVSFTGLSAKHSDDFLIGDYSNINHNLYHNVAKETGFNTVRLKTGTNQDQNPLFDEYLSFDKINQLDSDGIDVVVWDNGYWNNGAGNTRDFNPYSPYIQSQSNKMEFKTNYTVIDNYGQYLDTKPDWFYGFKYNQTLLDSSTIQILGEDGILCDTTSTKLSYAVFKDLYIRENMAELTKTTAYDSLLILPFIFTHYKEVVGDSTLYLYITFKMDIHRIATNDDAICKVGLKVAVDNFNSSNTQIGWDHDLSALMEPVNSEIIELELYQSDFNYGGGYKEFTYKLKLDLDYINAHLRNCDPAPVDYRERPIVNPELSVRSNRIMYMSPTLEFYCNRDTELYVKSVEFKDQVIKNWEELVDENGDSIVEESIKARINTFAESNIIGFDTYDEPLPAQFEAVKKLNELSTQNSSPHSDYIFNTAITNYGRDFNNLGQTYSLLKHFKIHTKNKILSPDPYLTGHNTAWYNSFSR